MIYDIENGTISKVLVYKIDRISRNISDFYNLYEMMNKHNCQLVSYNEQFDTSTSMGRGMMGILAVFAQMERENISTRIKDNYSFRIVIKAMLFASRCLGHNRIDVIGSHYLRNI